MRWQLDGWVTTGATTAGITVLTLVPDEVVPADGRQLGFWGGDQAAHDRADRTLARVQGMLGYDAVVTAVVQGGRTPAEQVRWVPWGEPPRTRTTAAGRYGDGGVAGCAPAAVSGSRVRSADPRRAHRRRRQARHGLRARRATARAARVRSRVVDGVVRAWAGPWPHDVRWWDPQAHRRCAHYQLLVDDSRGSSPGGSEIACVAVVENGRAAIEALYD